MKALGVYIYAGGFSIGMRAAGFDVLGHLEDGMFGVDTVRLNMPEIEVHTNIETWPYEQYRNKVDVVFCNPPCAPWSGAAVRPLRNRQHEHKDNYRHDPRVSCVYNAFDALRRIRPKIWVWESVQGAFHRGRDLVDELTEEAIELGYSVSYVLLNGTHLGLPQQRRRFFFVAHRVKIDWEYPRLPKEEQVTVIQAWKAAGLLRRTKHIDFRHAATKRDLDLMDGMPQGTGPRHKWETMMRRTVGPEDTWPRNERGHVIGRPGFNAQRLKADAPSNTMLGGPHLIHPTEDRWISVKEAQVLCSYPVDYEFTPHNPDHCYTEMGRAVLPMVGEWMGNNLRRALEREPLRRQYRRVFIVNLEKDVFEEITDTRKETES
jgi:site-specific DNA-cytosine methylase